MRLEKTTKAICENLEPVGAGALDSLVNNFTFGSVETIGKNKEVYGDDNRYYVGRLIADSAGIYLGVEGIVLGVGTEILGGALDLTGAGAPIGIQLNVAGIGIITGSATVVVNSGANFFQDAKDLSSNIEKNKDKAKSDNATKAAEEAGGTDDIAGNASKANPNNAKVHTGQQDKHIPGTSNYNQEIANGKYRSTLSENPQQLLDEFAGTGQKIGTTKERVDFGKVIGKYYDEATGTYTDTTKGIIHYNSKGQAHIVPARP
ncbi:hypothetical protein BLK74_06700 [Listeria monocytogenes]|uniref:polymorphic toxin type 50 domain-containing protein n=1 Tax=Listeria monocytogenes TaxID=1639 RepID=UPI0011EABD1B|nr:polymorphic toxin type 50 domain-containing protein [Listeria monocytogenes]EAE7733523.1 hypothetical protein [Listeria monocytogenes]EHX0502536.1 hypothetical protein [Listeria monocytogenes]TYU10692.1 hypothetical protein FZW82_09510 [Listeria monocytogenes]